MAARRIGWLGPRRPGRLARPGILDPGDRCRLPDLRPWWIDAVWLMMRLTRRARLVMAFLVRPFLMAFAIASAAAMALAASAVAPLLMTVLRSFLRAGRCSCRGLGPGDALAGQLLVLGDCLVVHRSDDGDRGASL